MNAIIFALKCIFLTLGFMHIFATILPCEFSFDHQNGYTCRVVNVSIVRSDEKITRIGGDHAHEKNFFNRSDRDVFRVIMFNRTIHFLPVNITFYFPYLKTLQVKNCGLKSLARSSEFRILRRMYLGFNQIKKIPEKYFWHFCRLEILSLHGNQISSIPRMAFRDLISIKRLSLNDNHLKSINSIVFTNCLNLEYIDLENNAMKYIESSLFSNHTMLQKVLMRNNSIEAIETGFLSIFENTGLHAFFGGNKCIIDFTFPQDGNYSALQYLFKSNCTLPPVAIAPIEHITTQKPRKKEKYKTPDMIFFENCTWHIHKKYAGHFRSSF